LLGTRGIGGQRVDEGGEIGAECRGGVHGSDSV
jgi:hypothetical protein